MSSTCLIVFNMTVLKMYYLTLMIEFFFHCIVKQCIL